MAVRPPSRLAALKLGLAAALAIALLVGAASAATEQLDPKKLPRPGWQRAGGPKGDSAVRLWAVERGGTLFVSHAHYDHDLVVRLRGVR